MRMNDRLASKSLSQLRYCESKRLVGIDLHPLVSGRPIMNLKSIPVLATCSLFLALPCLQAENAPLPAPIAHWKLEETSGQAKDSAGTHHGIIHGAVTSTGKLGKALLFDRAKGDHVSIPYSPDFEIGTFTVSAWVRLTKEPTFSGVLGTRNGGEFNFDMKVNADKVHGDIGDGTRWIETRVNFYKDDVGTNGQGGDLEIQRWFLITFVVDSAKKECRLYLDGDRKKTIPFEGEPRLMRRGQTMTIGNTGVNEHMDGVIDDLRIWKHALTDAQVKQLNHP